MQEKRVPLGGELAHTCEERNVGERQSFGTMCVMGIPKMGWGLEQRVDGVDGSGRVDVPMAEITADHEESSGFVPVRLQSLAEIDEKSSGWVSDKYGNKLKVISSIQSAECGESNSSPYTSLWNPCRPVFARIDIVL